MELWRVHAENVEDSVKLWKILFFFLNYAYHQWNVEDSIELYNIISELVLVLLTRFLCRLSEKLRRMQGNRRSKNQVCLL